MSNPRARLDPSLDRTAPMGNEVPPVDDDLIRPGNCKLLDPDVVFDDQADLEEWLKVAG